MMTQFSWLPVYFPVNITKLENEHVYSFTGVWGVDSLFFHSPRFMLPRCMGMPLAN